MIAAPALIAGPLVALSLAVALFVGMCLAGWGDEMDIGRVKGRRLTDALGMSGWGLVTVAPAAAVLWWFGLAWWPALMAGAAFGPIYGAAWWVHEVRGLPRMRMLATGPTEWAELAGGCLCRRCARRLCCHGAWRVGRCSYRGRAAWMTAGNL